MRICLMVCLLALVSCEEWEPWRSSLYPADWQPGFSDAQGRFLHDFSYAGYRHGEQPLPTVAGPVFDVVSGGADPSGQQDSTAAFTQAIDAAEQAGGGVVLAPAGTYRIDGALRIDRSGVVLRGAGPDQTRLLFTQAQGLDFKAHLTLAGQVQREAARPLAVDGQTLRNDVEVTDAAGLVAGDEIAIGWVNSAAFRAAHQMQDHWAFSDGQWRAVFRRTIDTVDAQTGRVTFKVPLRYAARTAWAASVRRESGYLQGCGVERLSVCNAIDWDQAWTTRQVAVIELIDTKDCWVRDVRSFASPQSGTKSRHLQSCGLRIRGSKRVTVTDCVLTQPQHRGPGGNGYLFEVRSSSEVLIRDCEATHGRHNFIQNWDFGTTGCVFLRVRSRQGRAYVGKLDPIGYVGKSEYHHALAMGNLVDDSELDDGWNAYNRQDQSSGAGHTATQCVFWNIRGGGTLVSRQFGHGYVIGTARSIKVKTGLAGKGGDDTSPEDFTEGLDGGDQLEPRSLYEDQLARRLD